MSAYSSHFPGAFIIVVEFSDDFKCGLVLRPHERGKLHISHRKISFNGHARVMRISQ